MDQERHRFVQQYVERQRAYLPTYTVVDPLIEHRGTPLKPPPKNDEYGFDTPVLRPRAPMKTPKAAQQASPSQSRLRAHEADLPSHARPPTPARLGNRGAGAKRKKGPTPALVDTDDERAARLADRRERKRKKRAIVNPSQTRVDDVEPIAAPKKGRTNGQKPKKPAALALLYGFSATNVTKDRLTVKPAPSLGVFNKGKASAKKNVAATKRSSSRNELFSESVFLNKPEERAADPSKADDSLDDSLMSSVRQEPSKKTWARAAATKAPQASTRTAVESEDWDIELQSKLPSSACDVSSVLRAESPAPVILDLRRAEWSASLDAGCLDKTRTPSTATTRCRPKGYSTVATSDLRDGLAADVSTIHPSHSASQVGGARAADTGPSDMPMATCKYFAEPTSVPVQELCATPREASRSTDAIEVSEARIPEPDAMDTTLDVLTTRRAASPISSPISVPQAMMEYRTRYDMVPLEFPRDSSPYDGFCADMDVNWDPLCGYVEPDVDVERCAPGEAWDWCRSWSCLAVDDVGMEDRHDPLVPECVDCLDEPEPAVEAYFAAPTEFDPEEQDWWYCGAETGQDLSVCEDDQASLDGEADVPGSLLLCERRGRWAGMSGLAQAEMDVARRLRDHWRPLRL